VKRPGDVRSVEIAVGEKDGAWVIAVKGEVDLSTSPDLRSALLKTIAGTASTVAVDLRSVSYMDSSGVATLIEGLQACHRKKGKLVVLAPSKQVRNVLELTRLDSVFEIRESL